MQSLTTPNKQVRVATWNVRTMYKTARTAQVVKEMSRYNLDILGISEMRWTALVALPWDHERRCGTQDVKMDCTGKELVLLVARKQRPVCLDRNQLVLGLSEQASILNMQKLPSFNAMHQQNKQQRKTTISSTVTYNNR